MSELDKRLFAELDIAEHEALKNLARYKFWMFGYFAARWVFLNRLLKAKRPNPFKEFVSAARRRQLCMASR